MDFFDFTVLSVLFVTEIPVGSTIYCHPYTGQGESPNYPHYSSPIQWARDDVGLKPSDAAGRATRNWKIVS